MLTSVILSIGGTAGGENPLIPVVCVLPAHTPFVALCSLSNGGRSHEKSSSVSIAISPIPFSTPPSLSRVVLANRLMGGRITPPLLCSWLLGTGPLLGDGQAADIAVDEV
jgi:hypothetical protein